MNEYERWVMLKVIALAIVVGFLLSGFIYFMGLST